MNNNRRKRLVSAPPEVAAPNAERQPASDLAFLRSASLTTVIQKKIEHMILSEEIKAGERLNEFALARALGVSRSPIREACRKLEQAGIVEIIKNRGIFVRRIDLQQAMDIYDIRAALAALAGALVAQRASQSDIDALQRLVRRMERNVKAGNVGEYYRQNIHFHTELVRLSGNPRLAEMFIGTDKELHLYRHRSLVQPSGIATSNREHADIVKAIVARDARKAGEVFRQHILNGKQRALNAAGSASEQEQSRTIERDFSVA
ncbi:GntR family transcriptional regulator [Bradyrhizobium sp. LHD-71]|uniref:GntR family transcriptional regulator n=1 Tax=Bradyrhizobium sp. LHD-71 TaxID=3072141 RepID=UPI00280D7244|nr:GntR family transcriptional regulator [Bradyrhizobium sp. LHD-71]MDQ8732143.1 GntR family transcriptional regulator [Bradyrhizobium sp. LHD-71]